MGNLKFKLLWSAFAMSLIFLSGRVIARDVEMDEFLGLEGEILPELEGPQEFSPLGLHQNPEWDVKEKEVETDSEPLRNQNYSLIPWSTLDAENWLDINRWLRERRMKDLSPEWKIRLRSDRHQELVAKILHCSGSCTLFRGVNPASVTHLSRIEEGDELRTDKDSSAWVFLMDGTLLRLGAESSISLQEINWSPGRVFFLVRLNQGHVYWHPRSSEPYSMETSPETDAVNLPIKIRQANREHFERKIYQVQTDLQRRGELFALDKSAIKAQIEALNEAKKRNSTFLEIESKVMLVAPNATIVSTDVGFDLVHYPGGKAYFKKRSMHEGSHLDLHLRGYEDAKVKSITSDLWHSVEKNGRSFEELTEPSGHLLITELITRRIKTFELAREIWITSFCLPLFKDFADPKKLAINHGYSLWGEEIDKRFNFLVEYTRRIETSNLKSIDNLLNKLNESGEKVAREINGNHYEYALSTYLLGLKQRYSNKSLQIREMNDLQYYVWILRNDK